MGKRIFFPILFGIVFTSSLFAYQNRNLLSGSWKAKEIEGFLLPPEKWIPYPSIEQREDWEALPEDLKNSCIQAGVDSLDFTWPNLPATVFMEFHLNGNRSNFQDLQNARRHALSDLVLAELIENQGRFIPQIVNGIWAICEETYWGVPAHLTLQDAGIGLPDVEEPTVDLFAAETGAQLAWIKFLLKPRLDEYHPLISRRIDHEIDRRVLTPCLQRDDFWWMGLETHRKVNNWNPWINSNWITCILLSESDSKRKAEALAKALKSLDQFINGYPDDGGCDEGPSYWGHAGGSLFDCLDQLFPASGGNIDLFQHPLIHSIGEYIMKVHIAGRWFINFADASARMTSYPAIIHGYGKRINNPKLMNFASFLAREAGDLTEAPRGYLSRRLRRIFSAGELISSCPEPPLLRDFWLPDLEVFAARDQEGSSQGFYLAGKGGHNAESHNHNDVGNFIIYLDGKPAVIDAGVETYTKKTFSSDRYEIWTMQSGFHNLPTINGVMQHNGAEYRASQTIYYADEDQASFSLELSGAYPGKAGVKSLRRKLILERGEKIILTDRFELAETRGPLTLSLLTAGEPRILSSGSIRLADAGLRINFPGDKFSPSVETISIHDPRLRSSWGDKIHRILLNLTVIPEQGDYQVVFER